VRIAHR